jgi:hypothetical protein
MQEALGAHQATRDEAVLPTNDFTLGVAASGPTRVDSGVRSRRSPRDRSGNGTFIGVIGGVIPLREYMTTVNLRRIACAASPS